MSRKNSGSETHIAQIFVWWATGIGLICVGIWTVFVYFDNGTINPSTFGKNQYFSNTSTKVMNTKKILEIPIKEVEGILNSEINNSEKEHLDYFPTSMSVTNCSGKIDDHIDCPL